jgi:heavy metal response regulator
MLLMMRILLVEDEKNVSSFVKQGLEEDFYTVDVAEDGIEGYEMASSQRYDLIILDLMLPGMDGREICRKLREKGVKTPVLMLTALNTVPDKVGGLESGADDYLTKPFAFSEMLARMKALMRRSADYAGDISLGDLRMDLLSRRVFRGDQEVTLSPREFALLEYLLKNKSRIVSRTQILEAVWGYDFDPTTNIVDVHIKYLRDKVDKDSDRKLIHTVRGVGYVLKSEDDL